jgi:hypothetical protein
MPAALLAAAACTPLSPEEQRKMDEYVWSQKCCGGA